MLLDWAVAKTSWKKTSWKRGGYAKLEEGVGKVTSVGLVEVRSSQSKHFSSASVRGSNCEVLGCVGNKISLRNMEQCSARRSIYYIVYLLTVIALVTLRKFCTYVI